MNIKSLLELNSTHIRILQIRYFSGGMNQGEDSKMKIHSMILKRQQAQQASSTQQSGGGVQDCSGKI